MRLMFNSLLLILAFANASCIDNLGGDGNCDGVACTEIFSYLTVNVIDSQSRPVALDSYKVILVDTDADITPENLNDDFIADREMGTYVVFSDNYADEYQNDSTTIRFTGFIDSEEVASSEFTVGADCCHVMMISESTTITID